MKPLMLVAMGVTAFTPIAADDTNEETTPFTADTFEMQPEELVEELSLVQEHTMDILMTDDYAFLDGSLKTSIHLSFQQRFITNGMKMLIFSRFNGKITPSLTNFFIMMLKK
ncbi:hypothetical protein JCM19037_3772 [Geomicrobium sp. JCM 19037]|uniref:hypothetical protein n=1 Tax=Geomicrobium sp. JCM 19037 TaxID=1460634 RepID=UPI00045F3373|nr:hypothetical protein [Geomicrobium sp. JCM 19037]GAK05288.1 hypothetical protein JCM19037_3772 [Geomicrobium sp. JCM 19037]